MVVFNVENFFPLFFGKTAGIESFLDSVLRQIKDKCEDFPGGPVVGNLCASAGNTGSVFGPGRLPRMRWGSEAHAPQLLSSCTWS